MKKFWRGHPATPHQQRLFPQAPKKQKPSQADLLIEMLRAARSEGRALELPQIMAAGIAQHSARIKELRERQFQIVNELESIRGVLHSRYYLLHDPERDREHSGEEARPRA